MQVIHSFIAAAVYCQSALDHTSLSAFAVRAVQSKDFDASMMMAMRMRSERVEKWSCRHRLVIDWWASSSESSSLGKGTWIDSLMSASKHIITAAAISIKDGIQLTSRVNMSKTQVLAAVLIISCLIHFFLPHSRLFRSILTGCKRTFALLIEFSQRWLWSKCTLFFGGCCGWCVWCRWWAMAKARPVLISVIQSCCCCCCCAVSQSVRVNKNQWSWVKVTVAVSSHLKCGNMAIWHQSDGKNCRRHRLNQLPANVNKAKGGGGYIRAHTSSLITVIGCCCWLHWWTQIKVGFQANLL